MGGNQSCAERERMVDESISDLNALLAEELNKLDNRMNTQISSYAHRLRTELEQSIAQLHQIEPPRLTETPNFRIKLQHILLVSPASHSRAIQQCMKLTEQLRRLVAGYQEEASRNARDYLDTLVRMGPNIQQQVNQQIAPLFPRRLQEVQEIKRTLVAEVNCVRGSLDQLQQRLIRDCLIDRTDSFSHHLNEFSRINEVESRIKLISQERQVEANRLVRHYQRLYLNRIQQLNTQVEQLYQTESERYSQTRRNLISSELSRFVNYMERKKNELLKAKEEEGVKFISSVVGTFMEGNRFRVWLGYNRDSTINQLLLTLKSDQCSIAQFYSVHRRKSIAALQLTARDLCEQQRSRRFSEVSQLDRELHTQVSEEKTRLNNEQITRTDEELASAFARFEEIKRHAQNTRDTLTARLTENYQQEFNSLVSSIHARVRKAIEDATVRVNQVELEYQRLSERLSQLNAEDGQLRRRSVGLVWTRPSPQILEESFDEEVAVYPPIPQYNLYERIVQMEFLHVFNMPDSMVKIPRMFRNSSHYQHLVEPNYMNEIRAYIRSALYKTELQNPLYVTYEDTVQDFYTFRFLDTYTEELHQHTLLVVVANCPTHLPRRADALKDTGWDVRFAMFTGKVTQNTITIEQRYFPRLAYSNYIFFPIEKFITQYREYESLLQLPQFPLLDHVMTPRPPAFTASPIAGLSNILGYLSGFLNPSQVAAINKVCQLHSGILLMQGPPGTGKTQSLAGMIASLSSIHISGRRPRVLVCAPSNAAINEVIVRLLTSECFPVLSSTLSMVKFGQITTSSRSNLPEALLIQLANLTFNKQREDFENRFIVPVTQDIERQTRELNQLSGRLDRLNNRIQKLQRELPYIYDFDDYYGWNDRQNYQDAEIKRYNELRGQLNDLVAERNDTQDAQEETQKQLRDLQDRKRTLVQEKRQFASNLIHRSDVVFCTNSSAMSGELVRENPRFDFLILDEACQAVELSSLIPFRYESQRVVLVGDPKQLPPTTFSDLAASFHYDRSLFERILLNTQHSEMLEIQYRMRHDICEFPSLAFYQGRLRTAPEVANRLTPPWVPEKHNVFLNLFGSFEVTQESSTSHYNPYEVVAVCILLLSIEARCTKAKDIGVITPYAQQVTEIRQMLERCNIRGVQVNTVDGFQGGEKDFIILSAVRTAQIGFLKDDRRLNVAITRAKYGLWIIGSVRLLRRDPTWRDMYNHYVAMDNVAHIEHPFALQRILNFATTSQLNHLQGYLTRHENIR